MTSARAIIQRVCEEKAVAPLELLGVLLEALRQSHAFHAGLSVADPKHGQSVEAEVQGLCRMVSADTPEHLLGALKLAVFAYELPAVVNARDARNRGQDIEAASLERTVLVGDTLRDLLQACVDESDEYHASERPAIHDRAPESFGGFATGARVEDQKSPFGDKPLELEE